MRDLSWWSGLFPFRRRSLAPAVSLPVYAVGIRSLLGVGNQHLAPSPSSALPPAELFTPGCTSMHFGENQLSPRSVGISPLSTGHPPVLQHWWVRASTDCHIRFTLPMDSSRGFGSHARHLCAGLRLGGPLAACEYGVSGTLSSPSRGAFHLSLTVLVHYRSLQVFSLGGWSPPLPTNSPGFVVLRMPTVSSAPSCTGLSPPLVACSNAFQWNR